MISHSKKLPIWTIAFGAAAGVVVDDDDDGFANPRKPQHTESAKVVEAEAEATATAKEK